MHPTFFFLSTVREQMLIFIPHLSKNHLPKKKVSKDFTHSN